MTAAMLVPEPIFRSDRNLGRLAHLEVGSDFVGVAAAIDDLRSRISKMQGRTRFAWNVAQMKALDIQGDPFHPEWNYTIRPRAVANRSG